MGKLNALSVKTISKPGRHGDGLYLNVAPSGTKAWVQRIVVNGKRRDMGLGSYSNVSLVQARSLASSNRTAVSEGRALWLKNRPPKRLCATQSLPPPPSPRPPPA